MREAVAAIITFEDEVFVIKRQNYLSAFPGYLSFVGGKVDEIDHDDNPAINHVQGIDKYLMNTLCRELDEELNITAGELLALSLSVKKLGVFVSPEVMPRRFKTHFIHIDLNTRPELKATEDEAKFSSWAKPKEILNWYFAGDLLIVPPVLNTLSRLASETPYFSSDVSVETFEPIHGLITYFPKTNSLPPAKNTNCFYLKDAQILVDPASKDDQEYKKFLEMYKNLEIKSLFLTHHHPDHVQNVNRLARDLKVPLYISQDTLERTKRVYDQEFFKDIETVVLKEGDCIGKWKDQDLLIMEVPGHDEGQLAIYPKNKNWIIASDLFQGIGTVVIALDEGDMSKYFKTLKRVIAMDFKAIIPSHGIPLGGVIHLQKILDHRQMREDQIMSCLAKNMNEDEILAEIYIELSEKLVRLARQNIRSHIEKIILER
jgi:ribonuclease/clavin/mitogillin